MTSPQRDDPPSGPGADASAHVPESRRRPRQRRAHATVSAILEAAAEVFAREGYARATTNRIAARAGVSIGSLYQYFPNKDALLAALLEQHHADVHAVVERTFVTLADPAVPLEEGLRELMDRLVALHHAKPLLTRALSAEVLHLSPVGVTAHEGDDQRARGLAALLTARPDVREGDHAAMAHVLSHATGALTRWLVHDRPPGCDEAALVEEVVQLLTRYLRS